MKGAEATPLGLSVSNSVTFFLGFSVIAFLTGGGAGFGGTYCTNTPRCEYMRTEGRTNLHTCDSNPS